MKTRIYLPVLAMLSLMLFSFTTNRNAEGSVIPLADGNYLLQETPLEDADLFRIDQLTECVSFSSELGEEAAARGIWIFRNKKHDDNKFTQKTFIGSDAAPFITDEDQEIVRQAESEINEIMSRYMN
jgi:predicted RNA-binding protein YlxR (DUF448 family)